MCCSCFLASDVNCGFLGDTDGENWECDFVPGINQHMSSNKEDSQFEDDSQFQEPEAISLSSRRTVSDEVSKFPEKTNV